MRGEDIQSVRVDTEMTISKVKIEYWKDWKIDDTKENRESLWPTGSWVKTDRIAAIKFYDGRFGKFAEIDLYRREGNDKRDSESLDIIDGNEIIGIRCRKEFGTLANLSFLLWQCPIMQE